MPSVPPPGSECMIENANSREGPFGTCVYSMYTATSLLNLIAIIDLKVLEKCTLATPRGGTEDNFSHLRVP